MVRSTSGPPLNRQRLQAIFFCMWLICRFQEDRCLSKCTPHNFVEDTLEILLSLISIFKDLSFFVEVGSQCVSEQEYQYNTSPFSLTRDQHMGSRMQDLEADVPTTFRTSFWVAMLTADKSRVVVYRSTWLAADQGGTARPRPIYMLLLMHDNITLFGITTPCTNN